MLRLSPLARLAVAASIAAAGGCGPSLLEPDPAGDSSSTTNAGESTHDDAGTRPPPTPPPGTTAADPTTGADSSTAADSSETSAGFIEDPDCGLAPDGTSFHCQSFECDVVAQDCPRGEKCLPWANDGGTVWNSNRCSPIFDDAVGVGEVCSVEGSAVTGVDSCDLGLLCWDVDPETNIGVCEPLCDPEDDACPDAEHCVLMSDDSLAVCVTACNPLDPASCPDTEACRWVNDDEFVCLPEQGGKVEGSGQVCGDLQDGCSPDQACLPQEVLGMCEGTECCSPWCDTTDPRADGACAALDPALACIQWYAPGRAPSGLEALGVCALPS